jgi:hypothetical protein
MGVEMFKRAKAQLQAIPFPGWFVELCRLLPVTLMALVVCAGYLMPMTLALTVAGRWGNAVETSVASSAILFIGFFGDCLRQLLRRILRHLAGYETSLPRPTADGMMLSRVGIVITACEVPVAVVVFFHYILEGLQTIFYIVAVGLGALASPLGLFLFVLLYVREQERAAAT